ncbi:MAG: FAD-dependent oxidoreductase [Alphaproteobacteria bacterium]|nr:FAD-dependent oxidoreductase [Alphaproteobacteria bacterium]
MEKQVTLQDLIIVGAGPAGVSAAVYAGRKKLKTILIAPSFGGQSIVSESIHNWIGFPSIAGSKLAESFETHVREYAGNDLNIVLESVTTIQTEGNGVSVTTDTGAVYHARALLFSAGSTRRTLDVTGAKEFEHKGLTYCASCDGPLFADQDVVVVGGGNAGFESAAQLLAYCKTVTLLNRGDTVRADPVTVEAVSKNSHFTLIKNAIPKEVHGEKFVTGITYMDTISKKDIKLSVGGIFVEIGLIPTTSTMKGVVDMDEAGRITIDPWTQKTSSPFMWAAGDCTNIKYHQNNIASGNAVTALEDIYVTLKSK